MLPGLGDDSRTGYASISVDGETPPAEQQPPQGCGCRRQWLIRLVVTGTFLALVLLAALALDINQTMGSPSGSKSHLQDPEGPDGGQALYWSMPWFNSVSHGVCGAAEKVFSHPVCPTTTTTTTTTSTITTTTETSTTSTTSRTTTTTSTTSTTSTQTTTSTTTVTSTTSTTTTTPHPLWPWPSTVRGSHEKPVVKGISYAPVPITHPGGVLPDDDFMSNNTMAFWGPRSHGFGGRGRQDLAIMQALGANAVRLYGNDPALDHSEFLNEAKAQNLNVVAGLSDYPYVQMPGNCMRTEWNCYSQIKEQYARNLKNGFLSNGGTYHPALRMVILMNEPDLKFEGGMRGFPGEPKHFCKALISAFDAVLSAEQEAGVEGLAPNFTVAFSFGRCAKCSGFQDKPSLGQMLELRHAMQHPHSVNYTARNDLWWAYQRRFVNSFNTQNSASEIRSLFLDEYDAHFQGTPVFIGEYHSPVAPDQKLDLKHILDIAADRSTLLSGISFFEFQVRYDKGGGEMNFGMFGLSSSNSVSNERIATKTYTAWCLTPMKAKTMGDHCGETKTDVDYVIESNWSRKMDHMPTAALCCDQCHKAEECHAWTWVQDAGLDGCPSQCWLKGAGHVRREPKRGVVSGLLRSDSSKKEPPTYVHDILAGAFGGSGVTMHQLCPTLTTTTTLMPPKPKEPASKPELVVSASWLGCFRRHGGSEPKSLGRRGTKSCARECRRHRYMFLREGGLCRCSDDRPGSPHYKHDDDEECSGDCVGQDGATSKGYCGASSHDAVYSIKVSERASGSPTPAPRLRSLLTVVDG